MTYMAPMTAAFQKPAVVIKETGILPFVEPSWLLNLLESDPRGFARAVKDAGVPLLEMAYREDPRVPSIIRKAAPIFREEGARLGAGTITNREKALEVIGAGATFLVSPYPVEEVSELCQQFGLIYIPGVKTLKQFRHALAQGWRCLKYNEAEDPAELIAIRAELAEEFPDMVVVAASVAKPSDPATALHSMSDWAGRWVRPGCADGIIYGSIAFPRGDGNPTCQSLGSHLGCLRQYIANGFACN